MANELTQRMQAIPGMRQIVQLLLLAGAIALGLWLFFWSQEPGFEPLYSGLADKDAAEVTEALRSAGIEFKLDGVSGAINVPKAKLHEARLKLAAQGLPQGTARGGMETMQGDQGFGVSQFVEGARYQHALETELARSIMTLRPVKEARIHLALPKPSAFARSREPAGASVVLDLYPGRSLEPNQVAAIVHLVSSSVPQLSPARVSVIDQSGRLLTSNEGDSDEAVSARQFEQARRVEKAMVERVRTLLEPLAGPGRVNAQVTVDMDFTVVEEARESYGPEAAMLRSEQVSLLDSGAGAPVGGIPGAASNTPNATEATEAAEAVAAAAPPAQTEVVRNATRNFEIDRTVSHRKQAAGRIRRVTAAVLIDHLPNPAAGEGEPATRALSEDELARVEALVREAVGFDSQRGDSVSVMNAAFVREAPPPPLEAPPIWESPMVGDALRIVLGGIAVLALLFGVLRPTVRQIVGTPLAGTLAAPAYASLPGPTSAAAVAAAAGAAGAALPAAGGSAEDMAESDAIAATMNAQERLRLARTVASQDSKRVAQVVRTWVGGDG